VGRWMDGDDWCMPTYIYHTVGHGHSGLRHWTCIRLFRQRPTEPDSLVLAGMMAGNLGPICSFGQAESRGNPNPILLPL
jgi:hypothetical protein